MLLPTFGDYVKSIQRLPLNRSMGEGGTMVTKNATSQYLYRKWTI